MNISTASNMTNQTQALTATLTASKLASWAILRTISLDSEAEVAMLEDACEPHLKKLHMCHLVKATLVLSFCRADWP